MLLWLVWHRCVALGIDILRGTRSLVPCEKIVVEHKV